MTGPVVLEELLRVAVDRGASDIHVKVPSPPLLRVQGRLERLDALGGIRPAQAEEILAVMLASLPHSAKQSEFEHAGEVDFAYGHAGLGRFRVNAYRQRGSVSIVIRLVPFVVPNLDDLGLPPLVSEFVEHASGLVLVTGVAGSGVTTTLAALVDRMNDTQDRSIVTIEDPIEVLHTDRRCAINQREIGLDTASFADALAHVHRHDPDVVVVSALSNLATIEAVMNIAESGMLVVGAMTSQDAGDAIERIVDHYPVHRQRGARAALAGSLRGVIAQRLLPGADGLGRQLATEILVGTPSVREAIAEGAGAQQLATLIEEGAPEGMHALDHSLARLAKEGRITSGVALRAARHANALALLLEQ